MVFDCQIYLSENFQTKNVDGYSIGSKKITLKKNIIKINFSVVITAHVDE